MSHKIYTGALADIAQEVRDAIEATITAARAPGETLADVVHVVIGDRERIGKLETPAVWVIPNRHRPSREGHGGHTATHDFTFSFVAMVRNDDPEQGKADAMDLVYRIYDTMLEDRSLGDQFVEDVIPIEVDPEARRAATSKRLFFASTDIAVRVRRRE